MATGMSGWRWRKLVEQAKLELPPVCWIDGQPIDMSLPHNHRMSWTLDHVLSRRDYPHLAYEFSNLRPAHRACNSSKKAGPPPQRPRFSRKWG